MEYKEQENEDLKVYIDNEIIEEEGDTREADDEITYCLENINTGDLFTLMDVLTKIIHCTELKKEESVAQFVSSGVFNQLQIFYDPSNEDLCLLILKIYILFFKYIDEVNETNFLSDDFLLFLYNVLKDNNSVLILELILNLANCIVDLDYNSANQLGISGFIREFVDQAQKFIKVEDFPQQISDSVHNCYLYIIRFIKKLFSHEGFIPEEPLLEPLIDILLTFLQKQDKEITMNVISAFKTILSEKQAVCLKFFKPYVPNMIEFIQEFADKDEDMCNGMMDVLYLFFFENNQIIQSVYSSHLIPFIFEIAQNNENYIESVGNLLHALCENGYIKGEDLIFPMQFLELITYESTISEKKNCAKIFLVLAHKCIEPLFNFLKERPDLLDILCQIVDLNDWDATYNTIAGFYEIVRYAQDIADDDFILEAFEENGIDPEKIDELIESAEELDDIEYSQRLQLFRDLMNGCQDSDYEPNAARPEGFEFCLDDLNDESRK